MKLPRSCAALTMVAAFALQAQTGQVVSSLRPTELRSDKLGSASVLSSLPAGAVLRLINSEGGWALVETTGEAEHLTGWVRAGAVNWQAGSSTAATMQTGRQASGNTALTLGVRSLAPRVNRHALIIGISRYADPATPPLPGARVDKESATQMAQAMQVPLGNIKYLQDDQATGSNIRAALRELTDKVQDGDRVFIHYSGHGTRYNDPAAGGCVEALLAYDGGISGNITNREMADMLKSITNKTDKLFVMYDACHSGGVVQAASAARTRGFMNGNDEGVLRPKFAGITEECGRPVNVKTRNLVVEATAKGALPQDIIHVSASRDNEISFDDELKGGLATQFMRDCMLRDAKDLDGSGAVSIDEIKQCAQEKINRRMANDSNFKAHNIMLNGNAEFVPAWFAQALPVSASTAMAVPAPMPVALAPSRPPPAPVAAVPAPPKPATAPAVAAPMPAVTTAGITPVPVAVTAPATAAFVPMAVAVTPPPAPLTGERALRQMLDQRDAKRRVQVSVARDRLRIGQDALDFLVESDRAGYVYVAMAGSDNKSIHLLFPNDLDGNNKIEPGQKMQLPRRNWQVKAGGPAGLDHLLVMVSDGPRDLAPLAASKAGPFVASLNDADGRAKLGALMTTSQTATGPLCNNLLKRMNNAQCSDAYGATMLSVEEVNP